MHLLLIWTKASLKNSKNKGRKINQWVGYDVLSKREGKARFSIEEAMLARVKNQAVWSHACNAKYETTIDVEVPRSYQLNSLCVEIVKATC